ncbi:MAG: PAAR domain-containing protein [Massilia sp.]
MPGPFIRLGDKTSHSGAVLEASQMSDSGGIGIARVGDKVSCPRHGNGTIVSGDTTMIIDGKAAARHGDKTSCGAVLIAGQQASIDHV